MSNAEVEGLGPDAEVEVNEKGGEHSKLPYAFHLLDPRSMFKLAEVMDEGRRRGRKMDNWKKVPREVQINHAITHLFAVLAGDTSDAHLEHAFTRCMMALAVDFSDEWKNTKEEQHGNDYRRKYNGPF